jgi:hypothetical protein
MISGKKEIIVISLSGKGMKGKYLPTLSKGVSQMTLSDVKFTAFINRDNTNLQASILISSCQEDHYKAGKMLADKYSVPIVALNSPFFYRYDVGKRLHASTKILLSELAYNNILGGGFSYNRAYVMKRIPKG